MVPDTSICVFFKPPRAGEVKTRLIPTLGAEGAAALAEALFRDTWNCVESLGWAAPVVATTDWLRREVVPRPETQVWLQGDGDLGARIETILRKAFRQTPFAMAIGADSPGIPSRFLEHAHRALRSADAVIGPCTDGGFYLLGVRKCPPALLAGIPWSQSTTFASTLNRLQEQGLKTTVIDPWYDIDRPEDLEYLEGQLSSGTIVAPNTASVLADLSARSGAHPRAASGTCAPNARVYGPQPQ